MGNLVLENALRHLPRNVPALPRVFSEIVLAAADVDRDALHEENRLGRLHQLGRRRRYVASANSYRLV
jgi:esterase/lipase superfamily enzyme